MSDSASPWGKMGPESRIKAARDYARENDLQIDSDLKILTVGYTAWREDRGVADVWREVLGDE